jgi:aspartate-semialdehyde dehydrogenase
MKVALLGAFGLVGKKLRVLLEKDVRITQLTLVGSRNRDLTKTALNNKIEYSLLSELKNLKKYDVIFSALDSKVSAPWYLEHQSQIACFIDKGSHFRLEKNVPLVIPELYERPLKYESFIASPNCVAIELALALSPIKEIFCPQSLIVTTLQSISGTGQKALDEFTKKLAVSTVYPFPLNDTVLGICGHFEGESTEEEEKIEKETARILGLPLEATVTAMRVPITRGHHLSISVLLKDSSSTKESVKRLFERQRRLSVLDKRDYPSKEMIVDSEQVFISRIRVKNKRLSFLVSADNLYVGAAYNAWKIFDHYYLEKSESFAKALSQF